MAERKGPEGERPGHEPVESGQQDDRSRSVGERNDEPNTEPKGTGSTDHGDGAAARAVTSEENPEPTGPDPAGEDTADDSATESSDNVLSFRPPERTRSAEETRSAADAEEAASESGAASERPGTSGETDDDPELLEQDEIGESVDLTALRADDALLDALGGTNPEVPERAGSAPNVEELLVSWRRDIDSAPVEELVDADQAAEALEQAKKPQRRGWFRRRHLVPVATAAAVLMIGCTGVGVAARDALPGDMLWGVAQVFYSDHTKAVQAATSAREDLRTAEDALDGGRTSTAESALRSAQEQMGAVDDEHGLSDLRAAHRSLSARVDEGVGEQDPTAPPATSSQEPPSSSVTAPPSSRPEHPPTEHPTTTPPTTSEGSTTPPTSSSEPSGTSTSESSTSEPAWDPSNPFFSGSSEGDQPSS
ncbi:anti-sigma-D factor RsdA [Salinifilum ghardaiensis]